MRACSTSSAFSLSSSTAARRTVQTLIGSYVALRTSTRPAVTSTPLVLRMRREPLLGLVASTCVAMTCAGV